MDNCIQNEEVYQNQWDHRKIGKEMELFSFHEEGPGFPFFLPKGIAVKNQLIEFWRGLHNLEGYREIQSPIMLDRKLWERSGHWDLFKENMYVSEIEKRAFAIKPMNCPGAILYYKEKKRNHREIPFRICEMGQCHRDENSGSLHGLLRVRSFMVDDAHIFCSREQLLSEVKGVIILALKILKACGFEEFDFELSVRSHEKSKKYLGENEDWLFAESVLQEAVDSSGFSSVRMEGEAKFYGPAIDIKIKDSAGRKWQCSSIQMDFNLPKRFNLSYFDEKGDRHIPYILHRCIFGSLERFLGVLLEHHKGDLPIWLAPVQVKILSLSEGSKIYAQDLAQWLHKSRVRFEIDDRDVNLSEKIKKSQRERVPIMLLVGDKEAKSNRISLRLKNGKQMNLIEREKVFELLSR